jgi:hypothetical protein
MVSMYTETPRVEPSPSDVVFFEREWAAAGSP